MARGQELAKNFSPPSLQVKGCLYDLWIHRALNEAKVFSSEDSIPTTSASGLSLHHYAKSLPMIHLLGVSLWLSQGPNCLFKTGPCMSQGVGVWVEELAWCRSLSGWLTGTTCSEDAATPATPCQQPEEAKDVAEAPRSAGGLQ